jgi:hypothetical protein
MIWIARITTALVLLFCLAMALLAYVDPAKSAEALGMSAQTGLGLNTYRADVGALFMVNAIACAGALFAGKRSWMLAPLAIFGLAVLGRLSGVLIDGAPEGVATPIIVELVLVAFSAVGLRKLS